MRGAAVRPRASQLRLASGLRACYALCPQPHNNLCASQDINEDILVVVISFCESNRRRRTGRQIEAPAKGFKPHNRLVYVSLENKETTLRSNCHRYGPAASNRYFRPVATYF